MAITKRFKFDSSLLEFGQVNGGFAKIKLAVMTDEQVANGTHFKKDVIDKRLSGLNYLPIVMEYKEEKQDAGSHGGKLEISDDGFKFIDTTKPYGVVIADSYKWEDIKLRNGETVPYVTVQGYVWIDRYPELECLYDGKQNNQSCEINVLEGSFNEETWVYEINDFEFSALCILGADVKPAFTEAKIEVDYSQNDFKADYSEMITALNTYLTNNGMEVFSDLDNEKLEDVVETTEEFEEQEETLESETVEEFDETESEDLENTEETETDEVEEEEFTEEETKEVEEKSVDYENLYKDLLVEYENLKTELQRLQDFEQNVIQEQKQAIIDDFSTKLSEEEISTIDMTKSVDEIEVQCFALLGKKQLQFSAIEKPKKRITTNFNQIKSTNDWMSVLADETKK